MCYDAGTVEINTETKTLKQVWNILAVLKHANGLSLLPKRFGVLFHVLCDSWNNAVLSYEFVLVFRFSFISVVWVPVALNFLQCFDTVGWVAERTSDVVKGNILRDDGLFVGYTWVAVASLAVHKTTWPCCRDTRCEQSAINCGPLRDVLTGHRVFRLLKCDMVQFTMYLLSLQNGDDNCHIQNNISIAPCWISTTRGVIFIVFPLSDWFLFCFIPKKDHKTNVWHYLESVRIKLLHAWFCSLTCLSKKLMRYQYENDFDDPYCCAIVSILLSVYTVKCIILPIMYSPGRHHAECDSIMLVCYTDSGMTFIIIIERRDYGGVLSEDCEDTEQSSEKVSKVRETVLRTRNCQTRPKLSCRIASSEQFSLQVPLKRWQWWWRGHRGRQAVPHPSRRHRKVRSPTVERRVRGMVSASEEDERRRRRVSKSATQWRSLAR